MSGLKMASPDHKVIDSLVTQMAQVHQKMSKTTLQTALSAPVGAPPAVTLAINYSIFIKWPQLRVLWPKMTSPDHKVAPPSQKSKKMPKKVKNNPQNCTLCSGGAPSSCYIGNQPLYLYCTMELTKTFRIEEGTSSSQSGPPPKTVSHLCQKSH